MKDSNNVGTLTAADIETAQQELADLIRRGWFTISTVVDHNGPGTAGEYRYLAIEQVAGPAFGISFLLGRNRDGSYSSEHVQSYDADPVELPKVATAKAAAQQIIDLVSGKLEDWGLRAA
ncbi:hypothetical protein [Lichenicoccus sp.]|uniref:hypothetical protein n=1 Tax=Lichenicoccus sp. TaxID=2781899 RepID=UPI003D115289